MIKVGEDGGFVAGKTATASAGDMTRQSWLQALERAGWKDALGAMRPFESGRQAFSREPEGRLPSRQEAKGETPCAPEEFRPAFGGARGAPAHDMGRGIGSSQVSGPCAAEDAVAGQAVTGFVPASNLSGEASASSDSSPVAAGLLQTAGRRWQQTNVVMLPLGQGWEVWIRDAGMDRGRVALLLADLRKSMGLVGCSLLRASLNGQTVYSAVESNSGEEK